MCPLTGINTWRTQFSCVANGSAGSLSSWLPRYSPWNILFFYSLGSFMTAINLILGSVKRDGHAWVRGVQVGRAFKHGWERAHMQDTWCLPRSGVQTRRNCFAHPNTTSTFCSGLHPQPWHFLCSSLVLLTEQRMERCASSNCLPPALKYLLNLLLLQYICFGWARSPVLSEFLLGGNCRPWWNYPYHLIAWAMKASYYQAAFPEPI